MMQRRKQLSAIFFLAIVALGIFFAALFIGSVHLPPSQVFATFLGHGTNLSHSLIIQIRLPRALTAFAVGGLLGLAGALMQVLLRNPLADPYVLGVSGGAATGALVAMLAGLSLAVGTGCAFLGALLSTILVFALAHGQGDWAPTRLLLTGVVIAAGWSAVVSLLLALSPNTTLRAMLFWLMGDLAYREHWLIPLITLVTSLALCYPFSRHFNLLSRGEMQASALGVAVKPITAGVYVMASILTAIAVVEAGTIGFVGLIVPHMIRLSIGSDHRIVLPASALSGGALLVAADTLARSVDAPRQLPVGVVTAALGVPLFLYLLTRSRQSRWPA